MTTTISVVNNDFKQVNPYRCLSIKNKKTFVQCQCHKLPGELFCGRHLKAKNVIRYDIYRERIINPGKKITDIELKDIFDQKIKNINSYTATIDNQFFPYELTNKVNIKATFDKYNLKNLWKYSLKKKIFKNTIKGKYKFLIEYFKKSDQLLRYTSSIVKFQKKFKLKLDRIIKNYIKVQSICRLFLVKNRLNCVNDDDLLTCESIFDIPSMYFISICDEFSKSSRKFGFDIRFLSKYFAIKRKKLNPYNNMPINHDSINKIRSIYEQLKQKGYSLTLESGYEEEVVNIEERIRNFFIDIDNLGNYTNPDWFLNLTHSELKKLYRESKDFWHYRLELTRLQRHQIIDRISGGDIFLRSTTYINSLSKERIQQEIILNYERLIKEGYRHEDRQTGALYVLSMLVSVSVPAANAMPFYVQNF